MQLIHDVVSRQPALSEIQDGDLQIGSTINFRVIIMETKFRMQGLFFLRSLLRLLMLVVAPQRQYATTLIPSWRLSNQKFMCLHTYSRLYANSSGSASLNFMYQLTT